HAYKTLETDFGLPTQFFAGLGCIAEKKIYFVRSVVAWIDLNKLLPIQFDIPESFIEKLPDRVRFARSDDEVVGLRLLKHHPDRLHIVAGIAPVALRVEISEIQFVLKSKFDPRYRFRDFPAHKSFAAARRFMVEENAIARKQPVSLTVIHGHPMRVEFSCSIRTARLERRLFVLRTLGISKHLAAGCLVVLGF